MCWNASVSLNTFLFSSFVATLALYNHLFTFTAYVFTLSFIFMQLIEYFIWTHLSNRSMNRRLSQIALMVSLLQPFFAILSCEKTKWIPIMLFGYALFILALWIIKPWSSIDFRSIPAKSGHLAWKWSQLPFVIILIYLFFHTLVFAVEGKWLTYSFMVGLVCMIYFFYHEDLTWGSMWCWISNGLAFYWLFKIFQKDVCIKKA